MIKTVLRRSLLSGAAALFLQGFSVAALSQSVDCEANTSIHCGSAPSAVFDANGRLWTAFVQSEQVFVSYSDDQGTSYSEPVAVNPIPEDAEHNGENRPKIIVDQDGTIYISWTLKTSPRFTGEIRFSRSTDGGKSFEAPRTINDDNLFAGHRFETLYQNQAGHLYLTWIDKRDLEAHLADDREYAGAAVYYAVSKDQGKTFSDNYRVADHSCECCRIAIAPRGPENIAILWRQIFGETTRDHAIAVLTPNGATLETHRASYDEWQIDACPHHGPTMVQSSLSGDYHMSWFTNGDLHQGIYYGKFSFDSQQPDQVYRVDGSPGAGHPYLGEFNDTLHLIWKGFDGEQSTVQLIRSFDDGASWTDPTVLATTTQGSDHPLVVTHDDGLYLSWHSDEYGYVFQKFTDRSESLSSD
ncbi:MAG: glycoside hydrolase [Pseudomonadales bacterium]|nr:glycoside hydrolase [Pseudomonadales bacterium]